MTIRWQYIVGPSYDINHSSKTVYVTWHNRLAIALSVFNGFSNINALVSPHFDGLIISKILQHFGYKIISGSTNKNAVGATMQIIKVLKRNENLIMTPDGPRGPKYKSNSNILSIAHIAEADVRPLLCMVTRYFQINSWDNLVIPLPFCVGYVAIGEPIDTKQNKRNSKCDDIDIDNIKIEKSIESLRSFVVIEPNK